VNLDISMKLPKSIKSIGYITIGLVLGKLAGFLKHFFVAKYFGIGYEADAFFVANSISEMTINIVLSGLISGALIPLASETLIKGGREKFTDFMNSAFVVLGTFLFAAAIVLFCFASQAANLIVPEYTVAQKDMIAGMVKIIAPGILFVGLAAVLQGILHTLEKFTIPAFGLFIANGTTVIFTLLFYRSLGIMAPVYGTTIGFVLWFLMQLPQTISYLKIKTHLDRLIYKLIKLSIPAVAILFFSNIILLIEKSVASGFPEGTVSQLNLAFRLAHIFSSLLVIPLSTVLLPKLSKHYGENNFDDMYYLIKRALKIVSFMVFPFLCFIIINDIFITKIFYGFIQMSSESIKMIALYLVLYSFAVAFLFYYIVLHKVYYSIQKAGVLVAANIFGTIAYLLVIFFFKNTIGSLTLPIAYIGYAVVTVGYLFILLKLKIFPDKPIIINIIAIIIIFISTGLFFIVRLKYFIGNITILSNLIFSIIMISIYILITYKKWSVLIERYKQ